MSKRKVLALFMSLILIIASCATVIGFAFAEEGVLNTVYLVNPTSICIDNTNIYVTDVINDGKDTVIHRISSDLADRQTYYVNGVTNKIIVNDINAYLMQKDKLILMGIDNASNKMVKGKEIDAKGIIDFTYFRGDLYYITDKEFRVYDFSLNKSKVLYPNLFSPLSVSVVDNKVAIMFGMTYLTYTEEEGYGEPITYETAYTHTVDVNGQPLFYSGKTFTTLDAKLTLTTPDDVISAFTVGNNLYTLCKDKKIRQYVNMDGIFKQNDKFAVGSDKVDLPIPTKITGVKVAYATKYPTNILYQASKSDFPAEYKLLTTKDLFLILSYDGMEQSKYHYIFIDGGYGWLEKADQDISKDSIVFVDTNYAFVGQTMTTAYVYSLPYYDNANTYALTNLPKDTKVSIHQRIEGLTDTNNEWYYISYKDGAITKYGYLMQSLITDIKLDPTTPVTRYTVNADLSNQLPVFADAELSTHLTDKNGKDIYLSSGKEVSVITMDNDNNIAYVQVNVNDVNYIGYLNAGHLIKDKLTNYVALGLILAIIAILGIVFLAIIIKRRKKNIVPTVEELDPFEAEQLTKK